MSEQDFALDQGALEQMHYGRQVAGESSEDDVARWRSQYEYSLHLARREAQAEGRAEGRAHGEAAALKNTICRLCELMGVPLNAERRRLLDRVESDALFRALDVLVLERRWPIDVS